MPGETDRLLPIHTAPTTSTRYVPTYLAQVQVRQAVPKSGLVSGAHGAEGHQRQVLENHERARPDVAHPSRVVFVHPVVGVVVVVVVSSVFFFRGCPVGR